MTGPAPLVLDARQYVSLQAAHDALPDGGGTILLTEGVTDVSATLAVSKPLALLGRGVEATILNLTADVSFVSVTNVNGFWVSGVTFQGNYPTRTGFQDALSLSACSDIVVDHCAFKNIPHHALSLTNCERVRFVRNDVDTTGYSGVRTEGDSVNRHLLIIGNRFKDVNRVGQAGHAAVQLHGSAAATNEYVWVEGNLVVNSGTVGLGLDSVNHGVVARNRIIGHPAGGEGIAFTGSHNTIVGNRVNGNGAAGILLWAVSYLSNDHNRIVGNTCWDSVQGIAVVWGENDVSIDDLVILLNRCYDTAASPVQGYGIQSYIAMGVTGHSWSNVHVALNDLRGNATGPMNLVNRSSAQVWLNVETQADEPVAVGMLMVRGIGLLVVPSTGLTDEQKAILVSIGSGAPIATRLLSRGREDTR